MRIGGARASDGSAAFRVRMCFEELGDDVGGLDASDDAQFAATLAAGLNTDGEDAFQALHPRHRCIVLLIVPPILPVALQAVRQ